MLTGFKRFVVESRRPSIWKRASKDVKRSQPYCSICTDKKTLEAHDIIPFRFHVDPYNYKYSYWIQNLTVLCRRCHRVFAHCKDPGCLSYNTGIESLIIQVIRHRDYCSRVNPFD